MVVNGVPVRKDRHVEPVVAMALDILDSVKELKHPTSEDPLTVTIGALSTDFKRNTRFAYVFSGQPT